MSDDLVARLRLAADWWSATGIPGVSDLMSAAADKLDICHDDIERLRAERGDATAALQAGRDLMAIIHRDGGHYREKHGDRKASDDAIEIVCRLRAELDDWKKAASERLSPAMHEARIAAAIADEREAFVQILEAYRVPVGNSPAGELAAEWTMDALRELRDIIRARGDK